MNAKSEKAVPQRISVPEGTVLQIYSARCARQQNAYIAARSRGHQYGADRVRVKK